MLVTRVTADETSSESRPEAADERDGGAEGRLRTRRWDLVRLPSARLPSLQPPRPVGAFRAVTSGATLLAGGAFVGFVGAAVLGGVFAGGSLTGRPAEPAETRAYIDALLARDANRLAQLQPPADLGARAAAMQQSTLQTRYTPVAISYLGGATEGPVGVYVYVLDVRAAAGGDSESVPFAFTVVNKKVVRVQ
jgi:hypothetical protein